MDYKNYVDVPGCKHQTRAIAWLDKRLINNNADELEINEFTDAEYDELCDYVANFLNDDREDWWMWWDKYHRFIKSAMMAQKAGVECDDPAKIFYWADGSLYYDVFILDVRCGDETTSHAFTAYDDEEAITVATDIVERLYHRELAAGANIDLMLPVPDAATDKAFYDECDFYCVHSFEAEMMEAA